MSRFSLSALASVAIVAVLALSIAQDAQACPKVQLQAAAVYAAPQPVQFVPQAVYAPAPVQFQAAAVPTCNCPSVGLQALGVPTQGYSYGAANFGALAVPTFTTLSFAPANVHVQAMGGGGGRFRIFGGASKQVSVQKTVVRQR